MNGVDEVKPLHIAGSVETEEMVGSHLKSGFAGLAHVVDKPFVLESAALRGFYYHKFYPFGFDLLEVYVAIMCANVYPHNLMVAEPRHSVGGIAVVAASCDQQHEDKYE